MRYPATRLVRPIIFANPLVEGAYPVIPPRPVPKHIIRPSYAEERQTNKVYSNYDNPPQIIVGEKLTIFEYGIGFQYVSFESFPNNLGMKNAAQVAAKTLKDTGHFITSSFQKGTPITEEDIDNFVYDSIVGQSAYPTPIGFMDFPKSVCVSVNECVVHGIPSTRPLEEGDKVNIDVSVYIGGVHGDNNLTVTYGPSKHNQVKDMIYLARRALEEAIKVCGSKVPFSHIGQTIDAYARKNNIHSVQHFAGHGVGELLHMSPQVGLSKELWLIVNVSLEQFKSFTFQCLHYSPIGHSSPLLMMPGNVFTIEPIFTLYSFEQSYKIWADNFTIVCPQNPNAQFEHTILITQNGHEVITRRQGELEQLKSF